MNAHDFLERHAAQREGVALAEIVGRGQRQARQVIQTFDIVGPNTDRIEFPAIFRRSLVSMGDGPTQAFGLVCAQFR